MTDIASTFIVGQLGAFFTEEVCGMAFAGTCLDRGGVPQNKRQAYSY
ncbi:MAG: hypothetical protein JRI70_06490 [Deltaproteobacteria bacterium]|nr:hypothetical protein [Deltaproteobacteria bacterium]